MSNDARSRPYNASGSLSEYGVFPECDAALDAATPPSQESAMDKPLPEAVVEAVARAICVACEENPDRQGDARGNEFRWQDYRDTAVAAISALAAAQRPAEDGCHCGTCTCNPNMTPAVRFDLSPAQQEGAIREHLIRLGWTPPDEHALSQPVEGEEIMVNAPDDVFILPLRPSGLDGKGPRFVVHVPGPEQPAVHPAVTHCDNCGCDWLDNGLNPVGCPYCKQNAWRAAFVAERATRYREGGMAVEQARIHAETEAAYLHARADLLRGQEEGHEQ